MVGAIESVMNSKRAVDHLLHVLDDSFNRDKMELPLVVEFVAQSQIDIDVNLINNSKPERPVFRQKRKYRGVNSKL